MADLFVKPPFESSSATSFVRLDPRFACVPAQLKLRPRQQSTGQLRAGYGVEEQVLWASSRRASNALLTYKELDALLRYRATI